MRSPSSVTPNVSSMISGLAVPTTIAIVLLLVLMFRSAELPFAARTIMCAVRGSGGSPGVQRKTQLYQHIRRQVHGPCAHRLEETFPKQTTQSPGNVPPAGETRGTESREIPK